MRVTFLSVVLACVLASPVLADPVDDYVRSQLKPRNLPGVSIAVVKDGRVVKSAGYGLASLELEAPATDRTVYEIGSISKQFAADAVLLLLEDGKLQLDDRLSKYIDGTPAIWSNITLRHVLTHTAGLADFDTGNIGFSYRREYTGAEFVELLGKQPLDFQPGDRWNYTNAFPLLGMVVERVSGMPYIDFVRTRIFTPLGLESARFKVSTDVVPHRADGYLFKDGAYHHGETLRPMLIAPNGGVMINVLDFAKWDIAISHGRLLKPETLKLMSTPVTLNDGRTVSHGLGWFMDTFNGHEFGAHWGTTVTGHSSVIRRYVKDEVTVIMLANLDDGGFGIDAMSKRIADMFVHGVAIQGLVPRADPNAGETAALQRAIATRKDGAALSKASAFEYLGEERVGALHFNLNPDLVRVKWYRVVTPAGPKYVTLRLSKDATLLGVLIEEP